MSKTSLIPIFHRPMTRNESLMITFSTSDKRGSSLSYCIRESGSVGLYLLCVTCYASIPIYMHVYLLLFESPASFAPSFWAKTLYMAWLWSFKLTIASHIKLTKWKTHLLSIFFHQFFWLIRYCSLLFVVCLGGTISSSDWIWIWAWWSMGNQYGIVQGIYWCQPGSNFIPYLYLKFCTFPTEKKFFLPYSA